MVIKIIEDLKSKGWEILKVDSWGIYARRKKTGKLAFFIESEGRILDETEISRIWVKRGYHPILFNMVKEKVTYYDFLSDEMINIP